MNSQQRLIVVATLITSVLIGFHQARNIPSSDDATEAPATHQSHLINVLSIKADQPQTEYEVPAVQAADDDHQQSLIRRRRQNYAVPNSDYYNNYYNDYYSNYYNQLQYQNQLQNQAAANFRPASADRFDGNGNVGANYNSLSSNGNGFTADGRPQTQTINGQKYVYTPLFQYKATQGHHQKLFVPNLFG